MEAYGQITTCHPADSMMLAQDFHGALIQYTYCYQIDTTQKTILSAVANCYYQLGDYANAKKHYHTLEKDSAQLADATMHLATIYDAQQNLPKAIKYYITLTKIYPSNPVYLRKLGSLYVQGNETTQALASYHQSLSLNPRDLMTIQAISELYTNIEETNKADSIVSIGLGIDSLHIGLSLLQSRLAYKNRDYHKCTQILYPLTYQTELNNYYSKLLGYAFLQIDSLDKSIYHLTKSLLNEGNPEYAQYYLALAYEKKKEYEQASYFYTEALKSAISPNISQYHRGMARIYTQHNKYKEVLYHYKEAQRYKEDEALYFYMGSAAEQYYKDKTQAIDYYQKYLQGHPDNTELEGIAKQRIKVLKEYTFMSK